MVINRLGFSSFLGLGLNWVLSNSSVLPVMVYYRYPLRLLLFLGPNLVFVPVYEKCLKIN
jgi:hypothetical protein